MKYTNSLFIGQIILLLWNQLKLSSSEYIIIDVHRNVLREGFHREIQTTVTVGLQALRADSERCGLLLIEHLPPSLYVDPFQLTSLAQFGGPQVLPLSPVDIEAPEYLSTPLDVLVFTPVPVDTHPSSDALTITVSLPVHVRYHRPSPDPEVSDVKVVLYHPRVLLNCSTQESRLMEAPCDMTNTTQCSWAELSYRSVADSLELHVPVGREKDLRVVVFATIVVTVMAATFLLYVIAFWDHYSKVKVK